jgi:hypothetical protein
MIVKKKYNIGDTVWIYGITNGKSTEGKIVQWFRVPMEGWDQNKVHYVVAIPTEIESLLEVRTWETISQTKDGHVGSLRDAFTNPDAAHRMLARTGVKFISDADEDYDGDGHDGMGSLSLDEDFDRHEEHIADEDNISPDAIHAALEKSQQDSSHGPLVLKEVKPKRRNYPPRKKKV